MISEAIFSRLSTDAGVSALVGTRVYPLNAPEGSSWPLITYQQIDDGSDQKLSEAADIFRTMQQIDVYALKRLEAQAIAKAVRQALDHFNNQTWGGLAIKSSRFDQQFDSGFDQNSNLHRIIQQYRIVLQE